MNTKELTDFLIYLKKMKLNTFCFIGTGENGEFVCHLVKDRWKSDFDKVQLYELKFNPDLSSNTSQDWTVCYDVDEMFQRIYSDLKKIAEHQIQLNEPVKNDAPFINDLFPTLGLFNPSLKEKSFHFLSSDSLRFLLFRLCFQVVIEMDLDESTLEELCSYCRNQYRQNTAQLQKIDQLKTQFDPNKAIYYYTESSFIYYLINQSIFD